MMGVVIAFLTSPCTLINISTSNEWVKGETAVYLREQLDLAVFPKDEEIMLDVRRVRREYPRSHWWWWPENL